MRRFFGRKDSDKISITGEEANHIKRVLRMKEGEKLSAYVNDEYEYICEIESISKDCCLCKILETLPCQGNPKKEVVLFQMLPKKEYVDSIIPKAIELGTSEIIFFESEYSAALPLKKERLDAQVMTACKQCRRSRLLPTPRLIKFNDMLEEIKTFPLIIFTDMESCELPLEKLASAERIAVLIGNEAGFSEEESKRIKALGATSISLGSRVLRCDTAVLSTLSLVSLLSGN